jgi:uncharacterized delta-60 repeat protein
VQLLDSGSRDTSFGVDGIAHVEGVGSGVDRAEDVDVMPDGRVIVVGSAMLERAWHVTVARLNMDGTPDLAFGHRGYVRWRGDMDHASGMAVRVQPDGRIIVAGHATRDTAIVPVVLRFMPDGGLDPTFGSDGVADITGSALYELALAVALASEGRVVIGTSARDSLSAAYGEAGVIRLLPDGTLDPSFGVGGRVRIRPTDAGYAANVVEVDMEGRVVVLASSNAVARLDEHGTLDPTFSGDGVAFVDPGSFGFASAMAVEPAGRIVLAGQIGLGDSADFIAARLRSDGAPDFTFSSDGVAQVHVTGNEDGAHGVAVDSEGRVFLGGYADRDGTGSGYQFAAAQLTPLGFPDVVFGSNGVTILDFESGPYERARAVALDADGRFVLAGTAQTTLGGEDFAVGRLLPRLGVPTEPGPEGGQEVVAVHPNPVRTRGQIRLGVNVPGLVTVSAYDALGRRVAIVHDGVLGVGQHTFPLDTTGWTSGIYALRVSSGRRTTMARFTVR